MTRKILSLILALAMILSMSAVYAGAETTEPQAGYYILYSMIQNDTEYDHDTIISYNFEEYVTLTLNEDGTAVMVYGDDSSDLTWGNGVLTDGIEDVPYTVDGDMLTLAKDGLSMTLILSTAEAPVEESSEESSEESKEEAKTESDLPVNDPAVHNSVTLPEAVTLVDQDGITVAINDLVFYDDEHGGCYEFFYTINNTSDKNIYVSTIYLSVNGVMSASGIYEDIDAGKSDSNSFKFYFSKLEDMGIGTVTDLNFKVMVYDNDTKDVLFTTDYIDVQTDAYGTMETVTSFEGSEIYNANDVIIKVQNPIADESDYYLGIVNFYVQNDSDNTLVISTSENHINGNDSDSYFITAVAPHKCAFEEMNISDDAEALGVKDYTEITDMNFDLVVYQYDDGKQIDETPISIAFTK